jgi:hypothetical protein
VVSTDGIKSGADGSLAPETSTATLRHDEAAVEARSADLRKELGLTDLALGRQEAFQLLWNASGIFYALTYLVMFALPLAGGGALRNGAPLWLKAASVSGFLMTLLFVLLSILAIVQVESRLIFALKMSTVIVLANMLGLAIFLRKRAGTSVGTSLQAIDLSRPLEPVPSGSRV